jgi:hypothetical protein
MPFKHQTCQKKVYQEAEYKMRQGIDDDEKGKLEAPKKEDKANWNGKWHKARLRGRR